MGSVVELGEKMARPKRGRVIMMGVIDGCLLEKSSCLARFEEA
jgi:hypothetical protein